MLPIDMMKDFFERDMGLDNFPSVRQLVWSPKKAKEAHQSIIVVNGKLKYEIHFDLIHQSHWKGEIFMRRVKRFLRSH
jgi:hypothetical protein